MEQHQNKLSPKFFFLSLGVLVSLIATVSSFLILAFESLNKRFPDALNSQYAYGYSTYEFESLRGALATLIIVFPIFLILSYFWHKQVRRGISHVEEVIRKWMIYLVTFLSSIVVVVDLVTLVRYFVSGEITTRFILKILVVLVTATIVGAYYFSDLKKSLSKRQSQYYAWGSGVLVLLAIIFSFVIMGSPMKQRGLRLDDRRVSDLQSIQWQVINYWQQKEALPETIEFLSAPISSYMTPVDPEFQKGKEYEYKKTGELSFELCATFSYPMPKGWQEYDGGVRPLIGYGGGRDIAVSSYPYPGGGVNDSWDHDAGYTCFERTIDPDIYPPFEKDSR